MVALHGDHAGKIIYRAWKEFSAGSTRKAEAGSCITLGKGEAKTRKGARVCPAKELVPNHYPLACPPHFYHWLLEVSPDVLFFWPQPSERFFFFWYDLLKKWSRQIFWLLPLMTNRKPFSGAWELSVASRCLATAIKLSNQIVLKAIFISRAQ